MTVGVILPQGTYLPPHITAQPQSLMTNSGSRVVLSVAATVRLGRTLAYQWYQGQSPIGGILTNASGVMQPTPGTNSTLDLGYVTTASSGSYWVEIINGDVVVDSAPAQLTAIPVPVTAGYEIPWPAGVDLTHVALTGPPRIVPSGAAVWNSDKTNYFASGTYASATVTWSDAATNAINEEVSISNPAAIQAVMGFPVPVPSWADPSSISSAGPHVDTLGDPRTILLWHPASSNLYATAAGSAKVYWPVTNQASTSLTVPVLVQTKWPTNSALYQTFVAGSAPVNLSTPSNGLVFSELMDQTAGMGGDASQVTDRNQFQATNAGQALLLLAPASPAAATNIYFQLVNSVAWTNGHYLASQCVIGDNLTNFPAAHDSSFGAPCVLNPLSRYCALPGT